MPRIDSLQAKTARSAKDAFAAGQLTKTDYQRITDGKISSGDLAKAKSLLADAKDALKTLKQEGAGTRVLSTAEKRVATAKALEQAVTAQFKAQEPSRPATSGGKGSPAPARPSTSSGKGSSTPSRPSTSSGKGSSTPSRPATPSRPSTGSGKGSSTPSRPSTSSGKGSSTPARPAPSRPSTGSGKGGSAPAPSRPSTGSGKGNIR